MTLHLPYLDYRDKMPRADWSIGTRKRTRYLTLHYNGPRVVAAGNPIGEIAQLKFDAQWHMRPGALGAPSGGDGIQYHGATLSDGMNLQLRDWLALLWHCGNYVGNNESIAWHVPIGGTQKPTPAQLHQIFDIVIPAFQVAFDIQYVNVKGHKEWKATDCPGIPLFNALKQWRATHATPLPPPFPAMLWYKTKANVYVRESPEVQSGFPANIALDGDALIPSGTTFAVDKLVTGKPHNGIATYVHRADQLGFMLNDPKLLAPATMGTPKRASKNFTAVVNDGFAPEPSDIRG